MKNLISSLHIPTFPVAKVGILLGTFILGEWLVSDLVHLPSGGLALLIGGVSIWFFYKSSPRSFVPPSTVKGWINRCNDVLKHFESLEDSSEYLLNTSERSNSLHKIIAREEPQSLAVISSQGIELPDSDSLQSSFECSKDFELTFSSGLPIDNQSWQLPLSLIEKDIIIYYLPLPLRAVDLLWLKAVPNELPTWVLVDSNNLENWPVQFNALKSQLPSKWGDRILRFDPSADQMKNVLSPVRRLLNKPNQNINNTRQRLLSRLHKSWQTELEELRRAKFRGIQNRSQWLVAGAVFASPVPSTDLLSVAVVNGLMIQEMGKLWSCNLKPDLLKEVARQLALAALAQGVVEWSGQALLSFAKLHGGTWLAAGTIQALSAAYMTRVVGSSMADWMALNNGVSEIDLEALKIQAPNLISKALEKEKVDWNGFVQQSQSWIGQYIQDQKNIKIQIN